MAGDNYEPNRLAQVPKTEDDVKAIVDYHIKQAQYISSNKSELQILYDAAEGVLDTETYKYVLNPFNTDNDQFKRFPAKLRNYDIIGPVLNAFMGESSKKPFKPIVCVANADAATLKKAAKMDYFAKFIAQDLANHLNALGIETGQPTQAIPGYDEINKKFELEYDDFRAKLGQTALDYIFYNQDIDDKRQEAKWHWLVSGQFISYKDVAFGDVEYEICDPRDLFVTGWGNSHYIEDADAVVYVRKVTPQYLLENWREELEEHKDYEDIVKWIKSASRDRYLNSDAYDMTSEADVVGADGLLSSVGYVKLYQVCCKLVKRVGILTYIEPDTEEKLKMPVDGSYQLDKANGDISIEYIYIDEVWNFYQIEDKWIIGAAPHTLQRNKIANIGSCKLPFNGRKFGFTRNNIWSVVKAGLNYQVLTNIFMYRLEHTLAKNKDKLVAFPLGLIPDRPDWDEDKFLYMAEAMGMMFFDEQAEKASVAIQGIKEINLSFGQFIGQYWELIRGIKDMYWDEIGMNRQRFGETFASDGKANTEQAIFRAAVITAESDRQFDKTIEKDYNGILDASKLAFSAGKKAQYVTSESTKAWFEMTAEDGLQYMETEFNIFVKNTTDEYEKLNMAKSMLQTMGQNGMTPDIMLEVIMANNVSTVKELAKNATRMEREFQMQMQQQQQEGAAQIQQMVAQNDEANRETKRYIADRQYQGMVESAAIKADADLVKMYNETMAMYDEAEGVDSGDVNAAKERIAAYKQNFLERQHNDNMRLKEDANAIKREQMHNQMKIAKENKN